MARSNNKTGVGTGSNKTDMPEASKSVYIKQSAVVYDLISEGEIEGLVDGAHSIYLNGAPILDGTRKITYAPRTSSNVNYTASSGEVVDQQSSNIFSSFSLDQGNRYVRVHGALATGNANTVANVGTVTPSSSGGITFAATHVATETKNPVDMKPFIRIAGAGQDGGEHIAEVISFNSSTGAVNISPPPKTTVNNATTKIDLVDKIQTIDAGNSKIVLANTGLGVNTTGTALDVSTPVVGAQSAPIYNFDNFAFAFRTGHRNQSFVKAPSGVGSGAVGSQINANLPETTASALGIKGGQSDTRHSKGQLDDFERNTLQAASGSGQIIGSNSVVPGQAGEVDQIKVTINHPNGLYSTDRDDGDSHSSSVEFKIDFQYKRGDDTFTETVIGPEDTFAVTRNKACKPDVSHTGVVTRKVSNSFNTTFSFDTERFQPFDDWTLKIFRVTPVSFEFGNRLHYNTTTIQSVEAIIEDKLNYPYSAFAAVLLDSNDFTSIPKRSYEVRGIKCKVPTNYFPRDEINTDGNRLSVAKYTRNITSGADAGSYQDWDGKFRGDKKEFTDPDNVNYQPVYTNNPAWVYLDILTNERYGLGKYIDDDLTYENIDIYQLYEIARYCDELVPDGKGGTEPRFTCNTYISSKQEAIKVLKDLLTVFRGILLWNDGEISFNIYQEKAPIFTFTKGNVVEGTFIYSYPSNRVRANQIRVTWNNPDNHYKQEVELVEDSENIAKTGRIVEKETVAYGCTSQAQAQRLGKYHLLTETTDSETVAFTSGIGSQILKPGDIIEVQDSDFNDVQLSGRVSSGATTTVIPVDRSVALSNTANSDLTLIFPKPGAYLAQPTATIGGTVFKQGDLLLQAKNQSGNLYDLDAQHDDSDITKGISNAQDDSGEKIAIAWSNDVRIETKAVSSFNATHVVVSSAFSAAPTEDVIYAISQTTADGEKLAGSPKQYTISEIKESEDDKSFSITAVKHTEGKYDEIDRGWVMSTIPDVMRPPKNSDGVPVPTSFALKLERGLRESGDEDDNDALNTFEKSLIAPQLVVTWARPASLRLDDNNTNIQSDYEHIQQYEIETNLYTESTESGQPQMETFVCDKEEITKVFDNIPRRGIYIVRIRVVATNGAKSPFVQRTITINPEKPAKELEPKVKFGGSLTSPMSINSANGLVSLSDSTYNMTPAESTLPTYQVTSGTTAQTTQSFSGLASGNTGYMLHDFSDSSDPWKAIEYFEDTTSNTGQFFRYAKLIGSSAFTQKTGTVTISHNSPLVTGTNTTFTTEYEAGDLLVIDAAGNTRFYATINHIFSNTKLELARCAPQAYSNVNIFAQTIQPNFIKDTIIGEVANTSGTFSLINYASGNRGEDAYRISGTNENHTFPANSSGAISDFSGYTNAYTVKKGTVSYTFASSGTTLNTFGLSLSTSNCTANLDGSGNITVSALTADTGTITVTITDRGDGNATIDTRIITLTKAKAGSDGSDGADGSDGSTGSDAKVVQLTASDSSIIYNAAGQSPTPSTSTDITLTATSKNFTDPRMKFTGDGITDETSFTASGVSGGVKTFTFPVPANIVSSPQTVKVEVQEGASGGTVALDTISIVSVKPGSDGSDGQDGQDGQDGNDGADAFTINLTNESHTFPADNDGAVTSFSGSGTKIEVFKGATLLTPVANTATAGTNQFKVTTNSTTNITVGGFTLDTTGTDKGVTIGDHSGVADGTDLSEIEYSINLENALTITKVQNFNKAKKGDTGAGGADGKRSVQGYLYYEKTTSGAPSAPGSNIYTFSSGDINGGSGATEVLSLSDGTATNKWTNEPRTQDPTSSNVHWTVRYSGTESSAGSTTCNVTYSNIVQYTNFTGVVTFTGGTFKSGGTNITTIDGGNISTGTIVADALNVSTLSSIAANIGTVTSGTIKSADHSGTADGSDFSTDGTQINLSDGSISSKNFRIASDGSAEFKGTLAIASITDAGGATSSSVSTAQGTAANAASAAAAAQTTADSKTTASAAATAANSADKTGGTVGGWTISSSAITGGTATGAANATFATSGGIMLGSAGFISANQFFVDTDGNANFKGTISGNDAVISGTLQTSNIQLGSFGANVSGTTIGSWNENDKNYREIGTIGTGAGVYMGTIQAKGGDNHIKNIHFHVSDTTVNTSVTFSDTSLHQQSNTNGGFHQRLSNNVDYLISESRLFGTESGNSNRTFFTQPAIFKYEGTGTVKLYIYAEADGANNKKVGHVDYRFIKLGTTDPQFSFTNLVGQALSTTLYANSQVTGGFSGTKTVTISGGSAQFKIDNGSFGTASAQISNGSFINVQMTSASSNQTSTTTTVTVGNTSSSWSITTGGTSGSGGGGSPGGGGGSPGQGGGNQQGQQQASFVYGTNLTLSDGTEKKVEDIEVGDVLKSFKDTNLDENATNPHLSWTSKTLENASHGTCTVQGINIVEAESFYIINSRLHVTGTHYVLVLRGAEYSWKQVKDLQPGDYMVKDGLTLEKILSVQPYTNDVDVYTFDTETADSYIAEGVVVYDAEI